jgi:AcrR family transcriptional regulator
MQLHGGQSGGTDDGGESTSDRLIDAAEMLFAEHGIAAVSLREINRAAGAKNAVAVQYHFRDREGIVRAINAKHFPTVDARRHAMLDEYEAKGVDDIRALAAALVRPLASKLDDLNGGLAYLQIYAELVNIPPVKSARREETPTFSAHDSVQRWRVLVEPFIGDDAARLHRRFAAIRFCATEIGRRARTGPHRDDRLFVSDLIDLVASMLSGPPSDETTRLMAERDAARRKRI